MVPQQPRPKRGGKPESPRSATRRGWHDADPQAAHRAGLDRLAFGLVPRAEEVLGGPTAAGSPIRFAPGPAGRTG